MGKGAEETRPFTKQPLTTHSCPHPLLSLIFPVTAGYTLHFSEGALIEYFFAACCLSGRHDAATIAVRRDLYNRKQLKTSKQAAHTLQSHRVEFGGAPSPRAKLKRQQTEHSPY
ncbi:unnamed protein product [Leuciscus chuanchicus]